MYETLLNKYAISQIAFTTDDLEGWCTKHSKLFGSGPFVWFPMPPMATCIYRGKEIEFSKNVAYGMYGDIQLEVMQPTDGGENMFTETGNKINHVCVWVDDVDQAIADFAAEGFEVAVDMTSGQGLRVVYIDTLEWLGFFVEIMQPNPFLNDMCKKLTAEWDGTEPFRPMGR